MMRVASRRFGVESAAHGSATQPSKAARKLQKAVVALGADDNFLEQFPPHYPGRLLMDYSTRRAASALFNTRDGLLRMQRLEAMSDRDSLLALYQSGNVLIRGRDAQGRTIVWMQTPRGGRTTTNLSSIVLYYASVILGALISRDNEQKCIALVIDDTARSLLDFNLTLLQDLLTTVTLLLPQPIEDHDLYFVCDSSRETMLRMIHKMIPRAYRRQLGVCSDRQNVIEMVQDKQDIPAWFLAEEQRTKFSTRSFSPDLGTLGNYLSFVGGQGMNLVGMDPIVYMRPSPKFQEAWRVDFQQRKHSRAVYVTDSDISPGASASDNLPLLYLTE